MIKILWGRKIGMTQKFIPNGKVIPVTVVAIDEWKILQRKTTENDGYEALQIGCLRNKYKKQEFSIDWLKNKKKHFLFIREIACEKDKVFENGSNLPIDELFSTGSKVSVTGTTIGKGFQGCVKRYGFSGGRSSHGDKLGRKPGSLSGLRTQGFVSKGKKLPGHDGARRKTISNLRIVEFIPNERIVLINGAVPGKSGSLLCINKGI